MSRIWAPSRKVTSDSATGHALLMRAGFICPGETGTFHYLPLGLRVLDNITGLIDKHMRSIGGWLALRRTGLMNYRGLEGLIIELFIGGRLAQEWPLKGPETVG
jgi:hypothetical protein